MITKKFTIIQGQLGDMAAERMTPEDWKKWNAHIEHLKSIGEYMKPAEIVVNWMPNPKYDDIRSDATLISASFQILDFGKL